MLKYNQLIKGKYYKLGIGDLKNSYLFRFSGIKDKYVCDYGYYVAGTDYCENYGKQFSTTNMDFMVIDFSLIVDLLPINHIEKIIYYRKIKIEKLLNDSSNK